MSFRLPDATRPTLSFEFYPPKTDEGWSDLRQTLLASDALDLDFVSVTYGAGGSTREKTVDLCAEIRRDHGIDTMAHLTCVGHSRDEIDRVLDQLAQAGETPWTRPSTSVRKYADHEMATETFPTAYSMMRSQPMIHATNSPRVAYE